MCFSNQISTSIHQQEMNAIMRSIQKIDNMLPDLVALSHEELASMPKLSRNAIDFVYEVLDLANQYPEFIPDDVEVPEIKKDVELIENINKILVPMRHLVKKLEDSAMLAGSEAYLPSLSIYNAVKMKTKESTIESMA